MPIALSEFDVVSVIRAECDFCGNDLEVEGADPQSALREAIAEGWTRRDSKRLGLTDGLCCGPCSAERARA